MLNCGLCTLFLFRTASILRPECCSSAAVPRAIQWPSASLGTANISSMGFAAVFFLHKQRQWILATGACETPYRARAPPAGNWPSGPLKRLLPPFPWLPKLSSCYPNLWAPLLTAAPWPSALAWPCHRRAKKKKPHRGHTCPHCQVAPSPFPDSPWLEGTIHTSPPYPACSGCRLWHKCGTQQPSCTGNHSLQVNPKSRPSHWCDVQVAGP